MVTTSLTVSCVGPPPGKTPEVPVAETAVVDTVRGLEYRYFTSKSDKQPAMRALVPVIAPVAPGEVGGVHRYTGFLRASRTGTYEFTLRADAPATLSIGKGVAVQVQPGEGKVAASKPVHAVLQAGLHQLSLSQEQTKPTGNFATVMVRPPFGGESNANNGYLYRAPDRPFSSRYEVVVTAPGPLPKVPRSSAQSLDASDLKPGLQVAYYEMTDLELTDAGDGELRLRARRPKGPPEKAVGGVPLNWTVAERRRGYLLRFTGWLDVEHEGLHRFHLRADSGAELRIGQEEVVRAGFKGSPEPSGRQEGKAGWVNAGAIELDAGLHPIRVEYFQGIGVESLSLTVIPPHGPPRLLQREDFAYRPPEPGAASDSDDAGAQPGDEKEPISDERELQDPAGASETHEEAESVGSAEGSDDAEE